MNEMWQGGVGIGAMTLWYVVGPPAVGKLTVAREIAARTGAVVVDNHLINDPVFVPMGRHRRGGDLAETDDLRRRVLEVVHEAARPAPFSHAFTNWLVEDVQDEESLRRLAQRRGARFVPVWLTAPPEILAERVVSAERHERAKLTDATTLSDLLRQPLLPAPEDAVVIDTTRLQPAVVADRILSERAAGSDHT